jgi:hypothetical protein|tara:strand:+ start:1058 stop:1855 length:798 start_codon:yes stop_codon:yes gene_type:complete
MADFNGTRDSNVAISTDNANRKVLILDTITNFDDGVGNVESAEGLFDLGGTNQSTNPTNFNGNIESSGFYTFANTLSLDAIYDVTLGAKLGMSSEDEYDLFDSGRGATQFEDAKAPFDGSPEVQAGAEIQVGFSDTSLASINNFRKIAQQTTLKGRFFKFRAKLTCENAKVRSKVHDLKFTVNFEKRVDSREDIVASASGTTVSFNNSFFAIPSISIMGQGMAVGDFFTLSAKTKDGFTIRFFNSSSVGISRTFDYQAQGFGLKS